jgi:hypothetical protein
VNLASASSPSEPSADLGAAIDDRFGGVVDLAGLLVRRWKTREVEWGFLTSLISWEYLGFIISWDCLEINMIPTICSWDLMGYPPVIKDIAENPSFSHQNLH